MAHPQADEIAAQLARARADTLALFDLAHEADLHESPGFGFRPIIWHLAHIGVFEAYWLLQKLAHGPEVLPSARVLRMATIDGARALGLGQEIGSIEAGKRADVIVVDLNRIHSSPARDVVSTLVYSAQPSDVRTAIIDGHVVMRARELTTLNELSVLQDANREAIGLAERAHLA